MPPKQATGRGRSSKASSSKQNTRDGSESSNPFESSDDQAGEESAVNRTIAEEEEPVEPEKSIPTDLLTRILHDFFEKDATRISRDANAAVGKYVDVFVREAIARAAVEQKGGFLEVEDLEKIVPQLLLDL